MFELLTAIATTCTAIETACTPFECETSAALADCLAVSASRLPASPAVLTVDTACTGAIRAQGGATVARDVPALLEAQRAGRLADCDLYLETVQAALQARINGASESTIALLWDASTVSEPLWVADSCFTHCYQGEL